MISAAPATIALTATLALAGGGISPIEWIPTDLSSANSAYFTTTPSQDPALFLGMDYGPNVQRVDFNSAPNGALVEGGLVSTQYVPFGVTMNNIRISAAIYGGNNYGPGFAAEHDLPQVYTFASPVRAVGIVNTSPDRDLIQFFDGPNATGNLVMEFRDQQNVPINFNVDRFVGGIADAQTTVRSFVVSNASGNLELDEMIFVLACPADFSGDGLLNFHDVAAYLALYNAQAPEADLAAPYGTLNFFDVTRFIADYNNGCQ